MATMLMASPFHRLLQQPKLRVVGGLSNYAETGKSAHSVSYMPETNFTCPRSLTYYSCSKVGMRVLVKPMSAVGSGLEASITDPKESAISIKNVEIVVESKDDDKMQVRVDLLGKETQIVFEKILRNLARTAPPIPGFRREKGGKTTKVPKEFLIQILGEDRVTNFVIQEIVSTALADYVKKENLSIKDKKINTIETAEELKSAFVPGNDFGFSATLEFEKEKSTEESS